MALPSPGAERAVSHPRGYPSTHVRKRPENADLRGLRGDGGAAGALDRAGAARGAARRRAPRRCDLHGPPVRRPPRRRARGVRRARVVRELRVGRAGDRRGAGAALRDRHRAGHTISVADGLVSGDAVFTVDVPASRWWDDIAYT